MNNDRTALTFDKVSELLHGSSILVEGLLFAPIGSDGIHCDMINENLIIIAIVSEGAVRFKINGTTYNVVAKEIFAIHPGDIIEGFENEGGASGFFFVCSVNRTIELVREVNLYRLSMIVKTSPVVRLPEEYIENIVNCAKMIYSIVSSRRDSIFSSFTCLHLAEAVTCEIYEGLSRQGIDEEPGKSRSETIFRDFLTMLTSMPVHRREVEWYADKLHITPKYLSDVCRKCSGRPASEWIKDYVMFDIRSHLKNSSKSIKEVSHRLGFSSLTFFGKCVRRWFGKSPTELREELHKRDKN